LSFKFTKNNETMSQKGLQKYEKLKTRNEFVLVQKTGKTVRNPFCCIVFKQNASGGRVGLTVSKKVGSAVVRNKIKRRLRHILAQNRNLFSHIDSVVIANPSMVTASFQQIQQNLVASYKNLVKFKRKNVMPAEAVVIPVQTGIQNSDNSLKHREFDDDNALVSRFHGNDKKKQVLF